MKTLPFITKISEIPFGLATQLRMGKPVAFDNEFKLSSYDDLVIQYSFKVDNDNALTIYAAYRTDPFLDFLVNVTPLYNIVKNYFGSNFNSESVSKSLNNFATVFNEKEKEKIFSLSFKEIEGSIMLVKRFHPGFFESNEEFMMGIFGMISGFTSDIYKDVVLSLHLSDDDKSYIYKVISSIETLMNNLFPGMPKS